MIAKLEFLHESDINMFVFWKGPLTTGKKLMQREMGRGEINDKINVIQEIVGMKRYGCGDGNMEINYI